MRFAQLVLLIVAVTFSMSLHAQGRFVSVMGAIKTNQQAKPQLRIKNSKQAAQVVKGRLGGKVLKVQKKKSGYRVKLIKVDGHIVSVYVDARSGRINGGH